MWIGDKGLEIAIAAKAKDIARSYENREISAGLKVKKSELKSFKDMSNWYMTLPKIQAQAMYPRKVSIAGHLMDYFGKMPVNKIEADDIEQYREHRLGQGAANGTIDLEVQVLRSMYLLAAKRKKIPSISIPGEFVQVKEVNPRRIITDDEFERMLDHADDDFKDMLVCAHETGMRLSEICNLVAHKVKLDIQQICRNDRPEGRATPSV